MTSLDGRFRIQASLHHLPALAVPASQASRAHSPQLREALPAQVKGRLLPWYGELLQGRGRPWVCLACAHRSADSSSGRSHPQARWAAVRWVRVRGRRSE